MAEGDPTTDTPCSRGGIRRALRGHTASSSPAPQSPQEATGSSASRFHWLRWVAGGLLVVVLAAEAGYLWPRLHESWRTLTDIHLGATVLCVALGLLSMTGLAGLQKQLLHAGAVSVRHRTSEAVVYGSTAMALTLPAGQVFSTAFTYRQTRKWGASPLVASWQLLFSGVVSAAGLGLVGIVGAFLMGNQFGLGKLVLSLLAIIGLVAVGNGLSRRSGPVVTLARTVLARINGWRGRPADHGLSAITDLLTQLESVKLGKRDGMGVCGWALVHRLADIGCLLAACCAVGAHPHNAGVMVAFTAGKAVGSIPLAPGGLVYLDATLIYALTAAGGLAASQAVAAAFVYRMVSFLLVALLGWLIVACRFRSGIRFDHGTHHARRHFGRHIAAVGIGDMHGKRHIAHGGQ